MTGAPSIAGAAPMTRATLRKLVLLGALYFAQGLPYGFFALAVPIVLRTRGWQLDDIGLTALLLAPWAFKFAWAPLVDRVWWPRLGRRRTWILAMQLAGALVLAALALADRGDNVSVMLVATFGLSLVAATQDIATDGLAVELLAPAERGVANGLQVAAYRIGMVVGGGVLLGLRDAVGQRAVFAIMAALTALASIPVLVAHEPPLAPAPPADAPAAHHFLRRPGAWRLLALILVYKVGETFGSSMIPTFLVDRGLGVSDIAWLRGTAGSAAGVLGAMAGGALVGRIGRRRSLVAFGIVQAGAIASYAYLALATPSTLELYAWCSFEPFASGAATAALFTCMMDWSERFSSGTDYTVQASAVVIAQIGAAAVSGFSARAFGYAAHFELATGLCAVAVLLAYALFPRDRAR